MSTTLRAKTLMFRVDRVLFAQALVPVMTVSAIVARRTEWLLAYVVSFASILATFAAFLSMRRKLGEQTLTREGEGLRLAELNQSIDGGAVRYWTLWGHRAHVYCGNVTWRFDARPVDALECALREAFGPPTPLRKRGSPLARGTSLAVAAVGLVVLVVGISRELAPAAVLGMLAAVLGVSAFGALSQRIAVPTA